jgi:hypothetical protein
MKHFLEIFLISSIFIACGNKDISSNEVSKTPTVKFGDEEIDYDANAVTELTQEEQNKNPKVIPANLDLWNSKIGKVLILK